MGICPGQVPKTMSPFCLLRVKTVPSEKDSASCGVLVDPVQSLIAIGRALITLCPKITDQIAFKNDVGGKGKYLRHRSR